MVRIRDFLESRGWEYKYDKYKEVFDYVEIINEVEQPKLSIIIVSWRSHPITLTNLEKLTEQRASMPFEIIFVDNGAYEGEFEYLKRLSDTYVRLRVNTGVCVSRNIGALFANAPLLIFLEDDGIPDPAFAKAHLLTHQKYDIISARGAILPLNDCSGERVSPNYYLGQTAFPYYLNIEGNSSIQASIFFQVGGWNDDIFYGMEGLDLSIRFLSLEPDKSKQIYTPFPIIYHDFFRGAQHFENKHIKQSSVLADLKEKYPHLNRHIQEWEEMILLSDLISRKVVGDDKLNDELLNGIYLRNKLKINEMTEGFIPFYDTDTIKTQMAENRLPATRVSIFGAGMASKRILKMLNRLGIKVVIFYDNDREKWGSYFLGIEVRNPAEITDEDYIVIASLWSSEIKEQLENRGLIYQRNFIIIK